MSKVPLPFSLLVCFIGIPVVGRYRNAQIAIGFVSASLLAMLFSFLATGGHHWQEADRSRLITLLQFVVPMFGLILGQLYEDIDKGLLILSKSFFIVLVIIVPLQFICSWYRYGGFSILSPFLYIFSIYQHLQYVPVAFVGAFLVLVFTLGCNTVYRKLILMFLPVFVLYIIVAGSLIGIIMLLGGAISYVLFYMRSQRRLLMKITGVLFLIGVISFGYFYCYRGKPVLQDKFSVPLTDVRSYANIRGIQERLVYWQLYGRLATDDVKTFLIGSRRLQDREKNPSAHNYYLDFIYHFGLLSLAPLLVLIGATMIAVYRRRRAIVLAPELLGTVIVVLFLLFLDNMLKVGLRQPYPGIINFFLWGILITKRSVFSSDRNRIGG